MQGSKRHHVSYRVLRILLYPFLRIFFRYRSMRCEPQSTPYIVLSNHVTMLDPFFVAMSFPKPMYFVASEHIFRWGIVSKLLCFLLAPVARLRATTEAGTALQVLRLLKSGENICIFPEGCCSFDGKTGPFDDTIGKLVKKSGAALITYRISGGYLMRPRWAMHTRRGPVCGQPVHVYPADSLAQMSVSNINAQIRQDLFVDAYAAQRRSPQRYRGRALAAGLPLALYRCPHCGAIGSIEASGNHLSCRCGLSADLDEFGFFTSQKLTSFQTVAEWMDWQRARISDFVRNPDFARSRMPICSAEQTMLTVHARKQAGASAEAGTLSLFADRLLFSGEENTQTFLFSDLSALAVHSKNTLIFSIGSMHYELVLPKGRSALPYLELFSSAKAEPSA